MEICMEERRKQAYRYLLYQARLEIRPLAWLSIRFYNPFRWKWTASQICRTGEIADWLDNLAFFSAIEFRRFDEERFWSDFQHYNDRHPEFTLRHYRDVFEREFRGEGHIQGR